MADHLEHADRVVAAKVQELGGEKFLSALRDLVESHEDFIVNWVDAADDEFEADEVVHWSVHDLVTFCDSSVIYVSLVLDVYGLAEGDEHMHVRGMGAYAKLLARDGALVPAQLEMDPVDLRSWITADVQREQGVSSADEARLEAEVADYLGRTSDGNRAGAAFVRDTQDRPEISDVPGADRAPKEVPSEEWVPWPVSDSAEYLDRAYPRYEGVGGESGTEHVMLRVDDGRAIDLGPADKVANALRSLADATGGSSGMGRWSFLFGYAPTEKHLDAAVADRIAAEARDFKTVLGDQLSPDAERLVAQLASLDVAPP